MSKTKLEIINEKDYKFDMFGMSSPGRFDKNNVSPLINRNINQQNKNINNSIKGNNKQIKNEEKNFSLTNENKNNYSSGRISLITDTSKLNATSNFNFRNNTFFQNNFYKLSLQNRNSNTNYYTKTNSNFNSTRNNNKNNINFNLDNEQFELFNSLNLSPNNNNYNKNLQKSNNKTTQKFNTNSTASAQKYFSPQNNNSKKIENFNYLEQNSNEESDRENNGNGNGKSNKMQKGYLNIEDKKNYNSNENVTPSKITAFSNEAIMNSTNKIFDINPQIVKKENLNLSGVNQEVNYYDFPSNKDIPINFEILFNHFPNYETAKSSKKQISDLIKSYAANTYQGLIRYKVILIFLLEITMKIEFR